MRSFTTRIVSWLALLCLGACATVQVQSQLGSLGGLVSGENIVLLSKVGNAQDFDDDDVDGCIGSSMRQADPGLRFVSARLFRENLYPYFMPSTMPHTVEDYKNILDRAEVRERIAALSVRYLVILTRGGTNTDWHGGIFCGAGYGGGGCLGLGPAEQVLFGQCAGQRFRERLHAGLRHPRPGLFAGHRIRRLQGARDPPGGAAERARVA